MPTEQPDLSADSHATAPLTHSLGSAVQSPSTSGLKRDTLHPVESTLMGKRTVPPSQRDSGILPPATHLEENYLNNRHIARPARPQPRDQPIKGTTFKKPNSGQESDEFLAVDALLHLKNDGVGECGPLPNWNEETWDTVLEEYPEMSLFDDDDLVTIRDHEPDSRPLLVNHPPIWAQVLKHPLIYLLRFSHRKFSPARNCASLSLSLDLTKAASTSQMMLLKVTC